MPDNRYAAAFNTHPGGRQYNEDAALTVRLLTRGQLDLQLAIVCDGVGGIDKGEVASRLAIETLVREIQQCPFPAVPDVLRQAAQIANRAVLERANGGKSTMALIAVHNDGSAFGRLYIASVGDSRIGLLRAREVKWLNRPHTVANEHILEGMPPEQAHRLSNSHHITRALGARPTIDVDIGFYPEAPSLAVAEQRGLRGLELKDGDTLFACSDGLIDPSPIDSQPSVRNEELIRHALDVNPDVIARQWVSYANSRSTRDNVSVAVVLVAPESKLRRPTGGLALNRQVIAGIAAAFMAIIVLGLIIFGSQLGKKSEEISQRDRDLQTITQVAMLTQTAHAYTATPSTTPSPTPSPTPRPTLVAGEAGAWYVNDPAAARNVFRENDTIPSGSQFYKLLFNHTDQTIDEGRVYLQPNSQVQIDRVSGTGIEVILAARGDVFLVTGGYPQISVQLAEQLAVEFTVSGSCMALAYDPSNPGNVFASCYEGNCSYRIDPMQMSGIPILVGQRLVFNVPQLRVNETIRIPPSEAERYWAILRRTPDGEGIADRCIRPYLPPPTPTVTPTPTATVRPLDTATPQPQSQNPPQSQSTRTSLPAATAMLSPAPACGNGTCNPGENCTDCPGDCGACTPIPPSCGNGTCNPGENCADCPGDCGACTPIPPFCGDGACNPGENCTDCPGDCGACTPIPPFCGDGTCNGADTCGNCPGDCGACTPIPPFCGDGQCNGSENANTCDLDCDPVCPNGVVETGEECDDGNTNSHDGCRNNCTRPPHP